MPILSITSQPPRFTSAYKPMTVVVNSLRGPVNQIPGERIALQSIFPANQFVVDLWLASGKVIQVGEVIVRKGLTVPWWQAGQLIQIGGTQTIAYNGVWRITQVLDDSYATINADDFGTSIQGTVEKHYENYSLVVEAKVGNAPKRQTRKYRPTSSGFFEIDISEFVQRTFTDVFQAADEAYNQFSSPGLFQPIQTQDQINQAWSLVITEAYGVVNANGVTIFTEFPDGERVEVNGRNAVNSIQPYHHVSEGTGEPDYEWAEDMDPYLIPSTTGTMAGGIRRFLTYSPAMGGTTFNHRTDHRLAPEDPLWLGMLVGNSNAGEWFLRVASYNAEGVILGTQHMPVRMGVGAFLMNVGPTALASMLSAGTAMYQVRLVDTVRNPFTEAYRVRIDANCRKGTRFYFLNSFGAIDQYTTDGPVARSTGVSRKLVSKTNVSRTLSTGGDYVEDVRSVTIQRKYEGTTRAEGKELLRWIGDEMLESSRVRLRVATDAIYTPVIFLTDRYAMGYKGGRIPLEWKLGVDNRKQRH